MGNIMGNKSWREMISEEMWIWAEEWTDLVACTLNEIELDVKFDTGYGGENGKPFTLWTQKRVYFPVGYDGAESVTSVSRDPDYLRQRDCGREAMKIYLKAK